MIHLERISTNLTDVEYEQVRDWIHQTRQGHKNAAWFVNSVRHGKTITKSQRGDFKGDAWYPFDEERRACCDEVEQPSDDNLYTLVEHCRTEEHVHNLLATLSNRDIRKEFHRMVKAIAATLENFGN